MQRCRVACSRILRAADSDDRTVARASPESATGLRPEEVDNRSWAPSTGFTEDRIVKWESILEFVSLLAW